MIYQVQCDRDPESILVEGLSEARQAAAERAAELGCACSVLDSVGGVLTRVAPPAGVEVPRGTPPSTYATLAAMEGTPGAWERVAWHTVIRALPISFGMWIVGVRGWRVPVGALLGSALVTGSLFAFHSARKVLQEPHGPGQ